MNISISLWIDELIERSSLGTPAARALRSRTTDQEVDLIDRLLDRLWADRETTRDSDHAAHIAIRREPTADRSES
jgi:hypothetical protein